MVQIINHVEVRKRIRQKQRFEVDFTHEIYNTFNQMPWLGEILMAVKAGLRAMLEDEDHYLDRACYEERFLEVWSHHHASTDRSGVEMLYDLCGRMHPSRPYIDRFGALRAVDCGDLMRLIGAWVEEHPGSRMAFLKRFERFGDLRPGGPWDQKVDKIRERDSTQDEIKYRRRSVETDGADGTTISYGPVIATITKDRSVDFRLAMLALGEDKHAHAGEKCGREIKRIPKECSDSSLKIDRLFGLRDMCSISGTTADVMYFLRTFGPKGANGYRSLGDIYRVLPFGTIAGFHHHSVLEVALPQSLKEYIDYRIGQYTTLVPDTADFSSPLTRSIWNTAWKYEQQLYNNGLHMICFYDEGFPEGAIVFEGRGEWERFFNSGVSSARRLSEVAPALGIGFLSFDKTMDAIQIIDPGFHSWLAYRLQAQCSDRLVEVKRFSTRLAA